MEQTFPYMGKFRFSFFHHEILYMNNRNTISVKTKCFIDLFILICNMLCTDQVYRIKIASTFGESMSSKNLLMISGQ